MRNNKFLKFHFSEDNFLVEIIQIISSRGSSATILLLIILHTCKTKAQTQSDSLLKTLVSVGFENIRISRNDHRIIICFENNIYRWSLNGIAKVLDMTLGYMHNDADVNLILLNKEIPQVLLIRPLRSLDSSLNKTSYEEISDPFRVVMECDEPWQVLKKLDSENSNLYKLNIAVYPQISAQFGNFSNPLETQINIAPALSTSFWKGMTLTAQVIFPLHNNFEEEGNYVRPGLLTVNQQFRLPYNVFASATVGNFTRGLYGFDGEIRKYLLNGRVSAGGRIGYTGNATMYYKRWASSGLNLFTWFTNIAYRYPKYDLTLKAGYGSFIDRDKGWRFDIYRQFREVTLGFFALYSGGVSNGGFNFIIPIPPRKYQDRAIRLRPASYFSWEYRARGLLTSGRIYKTGNSLEDYMNTINPDYIQKFLQRGIK